MNAAQTWNMEELARRAAHARRALAKRNTEGFSEGQPPAFWAGYLASELEYLVEAAEAATGADGAA